MTACVLILFVAGWLIAAVRQCNFNRFRGLKRHDPLSLVPTWSFFTPYPGSFDCKLLYRDRDENGERGPWREVELGHAQAPWIALWNPRKRVLKALRGALSTLISSAQATGPEAIVSAAPYRMILHYISSLEHPEASRQTQFMVLRSYGFVSDRDPKKLFVSRMHTL
jgi:hypothetical protein